MQALIRFLRADRLRATLFISFLLAVLCCLAQGVLRFFGLSFRHWTLYPFLAAMLCFLICLTLWVVRRLHAKRPRLAVLLALLLVCLWIAGLTYGFVLLLVAHKDEHIVGRDGEQMVAEVSTFLLVDVWYYRYVNGMVRGREVLLHEDYGELGYDPLSNDTGALPVQVTDYRGNEEQP